jgi:hypothetical protein
LAVAKTFTAGELATPFTVLVNEPAESVSELELIIFTAAAAIPFTLVVSVLAADVFATVLTLLEVADTPLTTLVIVLPDKAKVCVVAGTMPDRLIAVLLTPLTVVVKLVPDKELLIEFTMGTATLVIPLTVVVKELVVEVFETAPTLLEVADTPLTTLVRVLPDKANV